MNVAQKYARKNARNDWGNGPAAADDDKRDDLLQKSDMKNSKYEAYYRKQLPLDDEEWSRVMDTFREPLPSTFRIAGGRECVNLSYFFATRMTAMARHSIQDCSRAHLRDGEYLYPSSLWRRVRGSTRSSTRAHSMVSPNLRSLNQLHHVDYLPMRYPKGLAWQLNVPKRVLRKSPEFKRFHSFLVFETEVVCLTARLPHHRGNLGGAIL